MEQEIKVKNEERLPYDKRLQLSSHLNICKSTILTPYNMRDFLNNVHGQVSGIDADIHRRVEEYCINIQNVNTRLKDPRLKGDVREGPYYALFIEMMKIMNLVLDASALKTWMVRFLMVHAEKQEEYINGINPQIVEYQKLQAAKELADKMNDSNKSICNILIGLRDLENKGYVSKDDLENLRLEYKKQFDVLWQDMSSIKEFGESMSKKLDQIDKIFADKIDGLVQDSKQSKSYSMDEIKGESKIITPYNTKDPIEDEEPEDLEGINEDEELNQEPYAEPIEEDDNSEDKVEDKPVQKEEKVKDLAQESDFKDIGLKKKDWKKNLKGMLQMILEEYPDCRINKQALADFVGMDLAAVKSAIWRYKMGDKLNFYP